MPGAKLNLLRGVKEKVNRPFEVKLAETRAVIAHHFEEFGDNLVVAFSGGKDSEVVLNLCQELNPGVPVVFNNTGVEHPETVRFVAELEALWNLNLVVTHPERTFWECVDQYGFPDRSKTKHKGSMGAQCCYWLKEKPALLVIRQHGWLAQFTGITAVESWRRMIHAERTGICFHYKKWNICKVHPILWWTEDEVWQFITDNGLPVNEVYLKGAYRVGCMTCTAYKNWEEQMSKVTPKLYRIIKLRKDHQHVMALN